LSRYNGTVLYGKDQALVQLFATALPAFIMALIIFMASFIFFPAVLLALPVLRGASGNKVSIKPTGSDGKHIRIRSSHLVHRKCKVPADLLGSRGIILPSR
jgi:hypothetical protein